MQRVGIIGGLAPESTQLFYKEFTRLSREGGRTPELMMSLVDLNGFLVGMEEGSHADILVQAVKRIEDEVEVVSIVCNTAHTEFDKVSEATSVQLVSIVEPVIHEIKKKNYTRVGLLGTSATVHAGFYQAAFQDSSCSTIVLPEAQQQQLNAIIMDEMVATGMIDNFQVDLERMIGYLVEQGAEAVVLGCTELSLEIENGSVPLISSTHLLAKHLYNLAVTDFIEE